MLELDIIKENIKNGANGEIIDNFVSPKAAFLEQCITVEPNYKFLSLQKKVDLVNRRNRLFTKQTLREEK